MGLFEGGLNTGIAEKSILEAVKRSVGVGLSLMVVVIVASLG